MYRQKITYLLCPDCRKKRVTRRSFSDGDGYACDRCDFSVYIEEEGDQADLRRLSDRNPPGSIQFKYREGECNGSHYLPRSMGGQSEDGTWQGMCISCMTFQPMYEVIPPSKPTWPREFRLAPHPKEE